MAQLTNDEWPADNEPTTTEAQDRLPDNREEFRGHVPTADATGGADDDSELPNIRPDQAVE